MLAPMVSVCIPVYNGASYVAETISSVCRQTFRDIEIVVQDNASTDGTWQILSLLSRCDSRIKLARNSINVGMAGNWNAAMSRACGKYICLLSADDLFEPLFIEFCVRSLEENSAVGLVAANHTILTVQGQRRRRTWLPGMSMRLSPTLILLLNPFSINFTIFRKEILRDIRLPSGDIFSRDLYTCDYDLWMRLAERRVIAKYLSRCLGQYRWHDLNLSHQRETMFMQTRKVLSLHAKFLSRATPLAYLITRFRMAFRRWRLRLPLGSAKPANK
jgi:glycosyltransferase involved in cell wall biosynthesis